ncbi:MAG TPA: macro domain-containing protein [Patescibacteria group bacterium]|nr:macro domain-containing protein [Patescibacteria group bacterium]
MIRYVSGDLLKSTAAAIVHGVAPNDDFNHGLAHALREAWPAMYKDFRHFCQTQHPKSGEAWAWGGAGGARIVALFTQEAAYDHGAKPGRATTAHVNHALKALVAMVRKEGYASLALPRLATGVGGLDWADVKPLIEHHLADVGVPVYVYEQYLPGAVANEA